MRILPARDRSRHAARITRTAFLPESLRPYKFFLSFTLPCSWDLRRLQGGEEPSAVRAHVSAKLKDVVNSAAQLHGWNQPPPVNVNIANIPMPTQEERAEMRALDRKLDAFAAMLKR